MNEDNAALPLWSDERVQAELAERDASIAALKTQLAEREAWEIVPSSLEYDLITYAIRNGEIPVEYRIMRRRTQGGVSNAGQDG